MVAKILFAPKPEHRKPNQSHKTALNFRPRQEGAVVNFSPNPLASYSGQRMWGLRARQNSSHKSAFPSRPLFGLVASRSGPPRLGLCASMERFWGLDIRLVSQDAVHRLKDVGPPISLTGSAIHYKRPAVYGEVAHGLTGRQERARYSPT